MRIRNKQLRINGKDFSSFVNHQILLKWTKTIHKIIKIIKKQAKITKSLRDSHRLILEGLQSKRKQKLNK